MSSSLAFGASMPPGPGSEVINKLLFLDPHRLIGLVVKASASRAEGPGFESRLRRVIM